MEVVRYKLVLTILLVIFVQNAYNENVETITKNTTNINKTIENDDKEKAKQYLEAIANVTANRSLQDDQINAIIESINQIKNNLTSDKNLRHDDKDELNEAIILSLPKSFNKTQINITKSDTVSEAKTNEKTNKTNIFLEHFENLKNHATEIINFNATVENIKKDYDKQVNQTENNQTTYVEIMTIEPNNANKSNSTSHNIIEILKHLMPMFNSTLTKELHNITVIERDRSKNHSFSEVKNISTIIVTYCDKENLTKASPTSDLGAETDVKLPANSTKNDDFLEEISAQFFDDDDYEDEDIPETNLTNEEKKDIMEAADYGMRKMHELYSIMEPKLYSMGLWLDDTNPARYVAAFSAPSEEAARLTRYGYASLQAAARLRQRAR
ncbi:uncharacterized protein LOC125488437 [Plutella xylostella]|uniref:uncharacterized protein LOC125488437 n=1 Tax=Plutella xylostella TaxID=51655 RepID=UPI0020326527|nr:uncharacterized protein LOC125488437 [Plutella xylostella]